MRWMHVAVAPVQLGRDLLGLAHDGERVEDLVVDEVAHLHPLALLGEGVQLVLQVAPAVEVEHASVRRRRAVERDLLAGALRPPPAISLLVRAGDDERSARRSRSRPSSCRPWPAPARARASVTSRRYRSVVKPWQRKPSPTSPATSVISSPTPARKIFGVGRAGCGPGVEERRHQRVGVEVAAEVELGAVLPACPRWPGSPGSSPACGPPGATTASRSAW